MIPLLVFINRFFYSFVSQINVLAIIQLNKVLQHSVSHSHSVALSIELEEMAESILDPHPSQSIIE